MPRKDGVNTVTMTHRLSKEELDKQFELFLKEVKLLALSVRTRCCDKFLGYDVGFILKVQIMVVFFNECKISILVNYKYLLHVQSKLTK